MQNPLKFGRRRLVQVSIWHKPSFAPQCFATQTSYTRSTQNPMHFWQYQLRMFVLRRIRCTFGNTNSVCSFYAESDALLTIPTPYVRSTQNPMHFWQYQLRMFVLRRIRWISENTKSVCSFYAESNAFLRIPTPYARTTQNSMHFGEFVSRASAFNP